MNFLLAKSENSFNPQPAARTFTKLARLLRMGAKGRCKLVSHKPLWIDRPPCPLGLRTPAEKPSGLKSNSRISARNPLPNILTRGQSPRPPHPQPKPWGRGGAKRLSVVLYQRRCVCIRVGTISHWSLSHWSLSNDHLTLTI
jgi:hypothetical protein